MPYVNNTFGPILLQSIAGFGPQTTVLLNIPFGVMQTLSILLTSYLAFRWKSKSLVFALLYLPCVVSSAFPACSSESLPSFSSLDFYRLIFPFVDGLRSTLRSPSHPRQPRTPPLWFLLVGVLLRREP
jgi:predicted MFS family arabinose efflux permease